MGHSKSLPTSTARQGRRATLRRLAACFLAGAVSWISAGHGKDKKNFDCANPSTLSKAQSRQRKLDNYTEKSPDPGKTCSDCRFFAAAAEPTACGKCEIFNGPANPKGKCDDWTARPV
jgi:High potential iron-sulfur protein